MRSGNAVVCGVYRHGGDGDRISVKPVAPCLHGFRTKCRPIGPPEQDRGAVTSFGVDSMRDDAQCCTSKLILSDRESALTAVNSTQPL